MVTSGYAMDILRTFAQCLAVATLCITPASSLAINSVDVDPSTVQTLSLIQEKKFEEAMELEEKASKAAPKNWRAHAFLSFLQWQQGNAPDAIVEGQKAVRYAPQNPTALINLAHMFQALESYPDAIPLYEQAHKVAPDNWVPPVCLSRCYAKSNQSEMALQVLNEMAQQNNKSFDWNFQLGNAYLLLDKPSLAIPLLKTALSAASTIAEKSICSSQLLLGLLRDNQISEAKPLADLVLSEYKTTNPELYVRTAAVILPATSPDSGAKLLKTAIENLANTQDSDGFFRLGKVFEERGWLDNAQDAFNQAVELNPGQSQYHQALAGVLWRKGKTSEAEKELAEARSYDRTDQLAPYLVSKAKANSTNLSAVHFSVNGATCGCQVTRIGEALPRISGVIFANVLALKPYSGIILIDQNQVSVKDVFAKCPQLAFPAADLKDPITFDIQSEEKVSSLDKAIRIAQAAKYGDILQFPKAMDLLPPVPPS
jgi:tetratricopeptide (TPR) repeat protein